MKQRVVRYYTAAYYMIYVQICVAGGLIGHYFGYVYTGLLVVLGGLLGVLAPTPLEAAKAVLYDNPS